MCRSFWNKVLIRGIPRSLERRKRVENKKDKIRTRLENERVERTTKYSPRILEVLQRKPSVLSSGLLPLHRVLAPNSSGIQELGLPRLKVSEQVRDQLVVVSSVHSCSRAEKVWSASRSKKGRRSAGSWRRGKRGTNQIGSE